MTYAKNARQLPFSRRRGIDQGDMLPIERKIEIALHLAVGFWRDHRGDCALLECVDQRIGVVSLVADERARIGIFKQRFHRIAFHYTPKHASWLNQIKICFSILVRKLIRRGNFASKQMLKTRIEQFIAYFNATMARPFRWTYAGKPLAR
jgi:DDE superfamily endonuclease